MFDIFLSTWWGILIICLFSLAVLLLLSSVFYKVFFKRLYDIIFSLLLLIVFFIFIFPFVAIAIIIEDKGPVFYCGKRIGKNGKLFKMVKLRSMKVNAPDIRLGDGSTYNGDNDPRVTRIGRFLRKTSIDEIPQLLNVFIGQMSIIGPRPDTPDWLERYEQDQKDFLRLLPGITGYNQAYYRNSSDSQTKIKHDNYYAKKVSLFLDIKIIFKTIESVLLQRNINNNGVIAENNDNIIANNNNNIIANKGSAIRYLHSPECGIIRSISGIDEACAISGVITACLLVSVGDKISPILSSTDRIGYVISQAEDAMSAAKICEEALSKIKIEVDANE